MKKLSILLFSFFFISTTFAQKLSFPDSFKFDKSIFPGMVLVKIDDNLKKEHIFENPAVVTDEIAIRRLAKHMDIKDITKTYYEIYADSKGNDDAGVIVYEFNSLKDMEKVLSEQHEQNNYVVLTADRYLIKIWNDSRDTENRLKKAVEYYKKKVNAKKIVLKPFENIITASTNDGTDEATEMVDAVAEVAPYGSFYTIGFGSFSADLISPDQNRNLQNYAQKFKEKYQTEIAVSNIGNNDLTKEMIPGYASHLVFDDENRINNNIVILIDEVKDKSYIYFGKQNGKILKKLPLEKLKKELNAELEKGYIYKGVNVALEEFEIALIHASGQSAKIRGN